MSLTAEQIKQVQVSFILVAVNADKAAEVFYNRLFEIAPHTKKLFAKTEMGPQGHKLMETLAVLVAGLDRLGDVAEDVKGLGQRHVGYGVKPEDYQPVGAALLWALEQALGKDFTPATKEAWAAVYDIVSKTAIEAAQERPLPPLPARQSAENIEALRAALARGGSPSDLNLTGADLREVKLVGAKLKSAVLKDTNLSGNDLSGADLASADLTRANLDGCKLVGTQLPLARMNAATLKEADLTDANLTGATLIAAKLNGVVLNNARLVAAQLLAANLTKARLTGANLAGAMLVGATLTDADFTGANLKGANLTSAQTSGIILNSVQQEGLIGYKP